MYSKIHVLYMKNIYTKIVTKEIMVTQNKLTVSLITYLYKCILRNEMFLKVIQ